MRQSRFRFGSHELLNAVRVAVCASFVITYSTAYSYASAEPRDAKVAGQFYPASHDELAGLVAKLTQTAKPESPPRKPRILLVPHAGYEYSGPVAGKGFGHLAGMTYEGIVVIGFTHQSGFQGASADTRDAYRTPLGSIPVDQESVRELSTKPGLRFVAEAHEAPEHSLEVQLPFIQSIFPGTPIIPVLMGEASAAAASQLADALAELAARGDFLFVFSTDLSHYHPDGQARTIDSRTIGAILHETPQAVARLFEARLLEACGRGPILASLYLAERLGHPSRALISYGTSGDTAGEKSRVVGYAAIVMYDGTHEAAGGVAREAGEELVRVARNTLEREVGGRQDLPAMSPSHPDTARAAGVFVTLRKQGALRGCIGRIHTDEPLASTVPVVAVESALEDHRFSPVIAEELSELEIEVSVLTEPARLSDLRELMPGRDGVILRHQGRSGVFLPQVWRETGWTRVEFLRELASQKAGLPPDAWQQAELYVFQDQAFTERR